jgi:hypothetical protein
MLAGNEYSVSCNSIKYFRVKNTTLGSHMLRVQKFIYVLQHVFDKNRKAEYFKYSQVQFRKH